MVKESGSTISEMSDLETCSSDSTEAKTVAVPAWKLYQYADGWDRIILTIGVLCSAISGTIAPLFAIILGQSINATSGARPDVMASMVIVLKGTGALCAFTVLSSAIWQTCFMYSAARMATRIRTLCLKKVLGHDIAWFDRYDELAALPAKIGVDTLAIQEAIGTKTGDAVGSFSLFVSGIVIAFCYSWKLTLALCAAVPFLALFATWFSRTLKSMLQLQEGGLTGAGGTAAEALSSIRTVVAFGTEKHEAEKFAKTLEPARRMGIRAGVLFGLSAGALLGSLGALYAFALWFGAKELIAAEHMFGGDVVIVCIAIIIGTSGLTNISAPLMSIARACTAMGFVQEVLDFVPQIERADEEPLGRLPPEAEIIEHIEFRNVNFRYPRRLDQQVLQGLRLSIIRGQKAALVGESGSGKSTVFQLLERFYDPESGEVRINNIPLAQLPVKAWRRQIGYVGQEPVLFDTTVMANIKGGNTEITDEQAVEAARQANVYDFVKALPSKFETGVSTGGEQMSGGQKQRIAIARALVKRPQLLLLDEATSALDNESERLVQATLDKLQSSVSDSITTLTVAHRLSTVRNSDIIFVLKHGAAVEQGSHEELVEKNGEYARLVQAQTGGVGDSTMASPGASNESPDAPMLPMLLGRGDVHPDGAGESSKGNIAGGHTGRAGAATPGHLMPMAQPSSHTDGIPRNRSVKSVKSWMMSKVTGEEHEKTSAEIERERIAALGKYRAPIKRLLHLSRPQWAVYPVAILFAWLAGAIIPLQSYLFTMAFSCFGILPVEVMLTAVEGWCLKLLLSGLLNFLAHVGMHSLFSYVQECLVKRLRELTFTAALKQEVGYFDTLEHGVGGFTTSLARDPMKVASITGGTLGLALSGTLAILTGLIIAFWASWQLSLVIMAMMPLLVMGIAAAATVSTRVTGDTRPGEKAGATAHEALMNVRTVRALQAEKQTMFLFTEAINESLKQELWAAPRKGIVIGVASALTYPVFVAGLWYGGYLIQHGGLDSSAVYLALLCLLNSFGSAAMTIGFIPQAAAGRLAAHGLFTTIDRTSQIDAVKPTGWHRSMGSGNIAFDNVVFSYPARPTAPVLQGLSFNVAAGQTVALVGPSGSGKTTVTQLLQRFYDPIQGSIKIGGVDLRQFDVAWWRRQLGYVGQEPVLFDMSLEDNVRYGCFEATKEEVEAAAREANMDYAFNGVVGWNDKLGIRGQRLSGGQKQRCAIARAVLRRPQILILDEATSALDSASEHLVQQALETAASGRTTFTIAHRLSTILASDLILVLGAGQVVESGTAEELMEKEGVFHSLARQGGVQD